VQHNLESGGAQQRDGAQRICAAMTAPVELQDAVIQTLSAHLHFGHTQTTQPDELIPVDIIRPGFNDQPHVAVERVFIARMGFS